MQMAMLHCLPGVFAILTKNLIFTAVDLLQSFWDFMGGHEQIDGFDFGEILDFGGLSARDDEDVTRDERFMVDHSVYILADEEYLGGGDYALPENDLPCYLHYQNHYDI